jgi:hypothetical protein
MAHFFHHRFRPEGKAGGDAGVLHRLIALGLVDVGGKAGGMGPGSIRLTLMPLWRSSMRSASDQASSAYLLAA